MRTACFLLALLALSARPSPGEEAADGNLSLPSDLPDGARKAIEEAIAAFTEARQARTGRDKLLQKSIDKLRSASQKAPKSAVPQYYLGLAYQLKKSFPEARKALEKAVQLNPRFHEALTELGDVHGQQGDLRGSLKLYEEALGIEPRYLPAIESKSMALIRLGQLKEAQPVIERALEISPDKGLKRIQKQLAAEIAGPGWEKSYRAEGENYEISTPVSQDLADELLERAELIRQAYNKLFPLVSKPERKYAVWVYQSPGDYHRAGGPMEAGGHYDPLFRKLVLYQYTEKKKTFEVLNHEAFHQYLHDYLEAAPQWFNEGLGDYFGAFERVKVGRTAKMEARPNVERLYFVRSVLDGSLPPAADLMAMTQAEMYAQRTMSQNYAQAWAMIYFIMEGQKPQYQKALVGYFKALTKGLDAGEAYKSTFGKLDMARFDQDWKAFIRGVKEK